MQQKPPCRKSLSFLLKLREASGYIRSDCHVPLLSVPVSISLWLRTYICTWPHTYMHAYIHACHVHSYVHTRMHIQLDRFKYYIRTSNTHTHARSFDVFTEGHVCVHVRASAFVQLHLNFPIQSLWSLVVWYGLQY